MPYGIRRLSMNNIPRLHFAHLPTPIEELPNLSKALTGPRIFDVGALAVRDQPQIGGSFAIRP